MRLLHHGRAPTLLISLPLWLAASACESSTPADSAEVTASAGPHIDFAELRHDFGNIDAGAEVEHVFHFRNTGAATLELQQPKGS